MFTKQRLGRDTHTTCFQPHRSGEAPFGDRRAIVCRARHPLKATVRGDVVAPMTAAAATDHHSRRANQPAILLCRLSCLQPRTPCWNFIERSPAAGKSFPWVD